MAQKQSKMSKLSNSSAELSSLLFNSKSLLILLFLIPGILILSQQKKDQPDRFAQIGGREYNLRMHLLEEKIPEPLPNIQLPFNDGKTWAFKPIEKINTAEELEQHLTQLRKKFLPFMENYAPKLKKTRDKLILKKFSWREETEIDQKRFQHCIK